MNFEVGRVFFFVLSYRGLASLIFSKCTLIFGECQLMTWIDLRTNSQPSFHYHLYFYAISLLDPICTPFLFSFYVEARRVSVAPLICHHFVPAPRISTLDLPSSSLITM